MPTIGENIRRARVAMGWSQDELAQRLGYKSRSSINKIETGINDIPQSKVGDFVRVLGVSHAYLLGLVDEETQVKSDIIARIALRLRTDEAFRKAVECLYELDADPLAKVNSILALLQ